MSNVKGKVIELNEKKRIYHFLNAPALSVEAKEIIRTSNDRVKAVDGTLFIVSDRWYCLEIFGSTTLPLEGKVVKLEEPVRCYHFGAKRLVIRAIIELTIGDNIHMLRTADNKVYFVKSGWDYISLEDKSKDWTI